MNLNRYVSGFIFIILSFFLTENSNADGVVYYNAQGEQVTEAESRKISKEWSQKVKARIKEASESAKKLPKPKISYKRETVRVKEEKIAKDSTVPKAIQKAQQSIQIIGIWSDPGVGYNNFGGGVVKIYKQGNKVYLEQLFNDGSERNIEVIERRGNRFDPNPESGYGEHYIINNFGNLEVRDMLGLIKTAKKR